MTPPRRAMLIAPAYTLLDSPFEDPTVAARITPEGIWAAGFGAMLDRVAKTFTEGEGVVLLTGPAASALKLDDGGTGLDDARAAGWKAGTPGAWVTFSREGWPTVIVGFPAHQDFARSPLVAKSWHHDTVACLSLWQEVTGKAWRGTPGAAGTVLLRDALPGIPVRARPTRPSLKYPKGPDVSEASELDFDPRYWSRPQTERYAHGYDVTRMYLAAAQTCEHLAPWTLRNTGRIEFSPKLAGWWRVKLGPWQDDRIPAPAGPGAETRWVTTPTLALLAQLRDAGGPFQDFEILDSWTGDGKRLLREWAGRLEGAYQWGKTDDPWCDRTRLKAAAKAAYREAWGLLNRPTNSVYRPDWHHAILAQARSNLWRRMWHIGQDANRWPIEVKVDNVWYESPLADPRDAMPASLPLVNGKGEADALGTFKIKGTREKR